MNRNQQKIHKQLIRESQEEKRLYNKKHPDELRDRIEQYRLEKQEKLTFQEKRQLKRIKKKKTQRLKSLRRREEITVREYQEGIKAIQ